MSEPGGGGVSVPSGDPAQLEALASQLNAIAEDVLDLGYDVGQATSSVVARADWTGTAADAYTTFCGAVTGCVKDLSGPLREIASAVSAYAATLAAQQQRVRAAQAAAASAASHHADAANGLPGNAAQQASRASAGAASAVSQAAEQAAQKTREAKSELDEIMDATEPVRTWLDAAHLPMDFGGSAVLGKVAKSVEDAVAFARRIPELENQWHVELSYLMDAACEGLTSWGEVGAEAARVQARVDALAAFADDGWLSSRESLLTKLTWADRVNSGLSVFNDLGTLIKPEDSGALGVADRAAAGLNVATTVATTGPVSAYLGGLADANSLDEVPVIGEGVLVVDAGTGLYLGGNFVYHHWHDIEHLAEGVGNGAVNVVKGGAGAVVHAATHPLSTISSVGHDIGSLLP